MYGTCYKDVDKANLVAVSYASCRVMIQRFSNFYSLFGLELVSILSS